MMKTTNDTAVMRKRRLAAERQRRRRARLRSEGLSTRGKPLDTNNERPQDKGDPFPFVTDVSELVSALKRYNENPSRFTADVCQDYGLVLLEKVHAIRPPRTLEGANNKLALEEGDAEGAYENMQAVILSDGKIWIEYSRRCALDWKSVLKDFNKRISSCENRHELSFYLGEVDSVRI